MAFSSPLASSGRPTRMCARALPGAGGGGAGAIDSRPFRGSTSFMVVLQPVAQPRAKGAGRRDVFAVLVATLAVGLGRAAAPPGGGPAGGGRVLGDAVGRLGVGARDLDRPKGQPLADETKAVRPDFAVGVGDLHD